MYIFFFETQNLVFVLRASSGTLQTQSNIHRSNSRHLRVTYVQNGYLFLKKDREKKRFLRPRWSLCTRECLKSQQSQHSYEREDLKPKISSMSQRDKKRDLRLKCIHYSESLTRLKHWYFFWTNSWQNHPALHDPYCAVGAGKKINLLKTVLEHCLTWHQTIHKSTSYSSSTFFFLCKLNASM